MVIKKDNRGKSKGSSKGTPAKKQKSEKTSKNNTDKKAVRRLPEGKVLHGVSGVLKNPEKRKTLEELLKDQAKREKRLKHQKYRENRKVIKERRLAMSKQKRKAFYEKVRIETNEHTRRTKERGAKKEERTRRGKDKKGSCQKRKEA
ncbi:hypothetical protein ADUPG1_010703 [Aduncisulcus paluster]|uniref:Ribosomal RNA-processing protein 14/surfeit locus protein 6 C-terminal domain-containing protein n=1 Tax=Aduncisulcus paluster TaxID=2918883 RepID=A0ABQ5JSH0_9EUKA|nr:hypothetical protein ADUPG1_010703 [Aduncisulcus paluster]